MNTYPTSTLEFQDWGLIDYDKALVKQLELLEQTSLQQKPGYLIFCSHPPIVTLGRATQPNDIQNWLGRTLEVSRGGRATYHGPSQLIIYPIVNLQHQRHGRKAHEIAGYLRAFENAFIQFLINFYGLQARGKSVEDTGVWVENKKLVSLGIAVKKWITYHGAAINLDYDPQAFKGLHPCGLSPNIMTCLEHLVGEKINREKFVKNLKTYLLQTL